MKTCFVLIISSLLISACKLNGEIKPFSGNSFFKNDGTGRRMILSDNKLLHRTDIYPDIVDYNFDKDFIIAKQVPSITNWSPYLGANLYSRFVSYLHARNNYFRTENSEIIKQDSITYKMFVDRNATDQNTPHDIIVSATVADSLIKFDPYYKKIISNLENYWIIDNTKDILIGPLNKEEYLRQREKLKIPESLQLK